MSVGVMTLRVSRDAGRTWSRVVRVAPDPSKGVERMPRPMLYPPCRCPRCAVRHAS